MNSYSVRRIGSQPNTFIVGAPKCGTTTLAAYLAAHPSAYVCDPKEPNYWSFDHAGNVDYNGQNFKTENDYLQIFRSCSPDVERVVCDASTSYIWSEAAIDRIAARYPDSRFILMLRNPAELSLSLYREERFSFAEDQSDFWVAWGLQEQRALGCHIPIACKEPKKLQYRKIAAVGTHANRLQKLVPENRRKILLLDDLIVSPAKTWLEVQNFLGLPDDGRTDFPVVNSAKQHPFPRLAKALLRPGYLSAPVLNVLRQFAWASGMKGLRSNLVKHLAKHGKIDKSGDSKIVKKLMTEFEGEISLLETVLNRDLSHWRRKYA